MLEQNLGTTEDVELFTEVLDNMIRDEVNKNVLMMLVNTDVSSIEELGSAIRRALTHPSIRGKFDGVSPLLKQFGYSRVVVTDAGLKFISLKDGKIRILVKS